MLTIDLGMIKVCLNNSEKIKSINWRPKVNWAQGLEKTIKWYLDNKEFLTTYSGKRLGKS